MIEMLIKKGAPIYVVRFGFSNATITKYSFYSGIHKQLSMNNEDVDIDYITVSKYEDGRYLEDIWLDEWFVSIDEAISYMKNQLIRLYGG